MTLTVTPLPDDMLEAAFLTVIIDYAKLRHWRVNHQRPAQVRNGRWATAVTGHVGAPDLLLARDGTVILAELKSNRGRLGPGQPEWADAIGAQHRLWRPVDWPQIVEELT